MLLYNEVHVIAAGSRDEPSRAEPRRAEPNRAERRPLAEPNAFHLFKSTVCSRNIKSFCEIENDVLMHIAFFRVLPQCRERLTAAAAASVGTLDTFCNNTVNSR